MFNSEEYVLKVYGSFYLFMLFLVPAMMLCIGVIPNIYVAIAASFILSLALYFYFRARYLFYNDRIIIRRRFRKELVILHRRVIEAKFLEYRGNTVIALKHWHKGKETGTSLDLGYDGLSVHGLFLQQGLNIVS